MAAAPGYGVAWDNTSFCPPELVMSKDNSGLEDIFAELNDAVGDLKLDKVTTKKDKKQLAPLVGESAFPTEMSCNQVFDMLLKCYSVGGQVRHYYRHGEMSYCQDKKDKMKFCMSTKFMSKENRERAISEWYMKQLAQQKTEHKTSEDIWNARTEPLRRPFQEEE